MDFHLEERRAWVRTSTHTVIFDRDPDYDYFAANPSGVVTRLVRIWTRDRSGAAPSAYLGAVCLRPDGYCPGQVARVFRRLAACSGDRLEFLDARARLNRVLKDIR